MKTVQQIALGLANLLAPDDASDLKMMQVLNQCHAALAEARRDALLEAAELCRDVAKSLAPFHSAMPSGAYACAKAIEARAAEEDK